MRTPIEIYADKLEEAEHWCSEVNIEALDGLWECVTELVDSPHILAVMGKPFWRDTLDPIIEWGPSELVSLLMFALRGIPARSDDGRYSVMVAGCNYGRDENDPFTLEIYFSADGYVTETGHCDRMTRLFVPPTVAAQIYLDVLKDNKMNLWTDIPEDRPKFPFGKEV